MSVVRVTAGSDDFLRSTKFLSLIIKINAEDNKWDINTFMTEVSIV